MNFQHNNNRYGIKADRAELVAFKEVQRVTNLSASTIRRRVSAGIFPPPYPGLTRRKWKKIDIETYLDWREPEPWNPWKTPA